MSSVHANCNSIESVKTMTYQTTFKRLLLGTIAIGFWCGGCDSHERAPKHVIQPDVLLVILDTVRADRLHTYGNPRPTSSQLDAIAAAGVVFEDVTVSGPWSWPSHASIFTGLQPWEHGAHWGDGGTPSVGQSQISADLAFQQPAS